MGSFIALKILIWNFFDFGQDSKSTAKRFAKLPFDLLGDGRFLRLSDASRYHFIRILIEAQSSSDEHLIVRRSLFDSKTKSSLSQILHPLIDNQLVEIIDDTVLVKRREEKKRDTTTTENTSSNPPEKQNLKNQISEAWDVWLKTLKTFGLPERKISMPQELSIARGIQSLGFENVCLALEGQRFEPKTETFNPITALSVDRVLHRDSKGNSRWEKFVNMALAARAEKEAEETAKREAEGVES